MGVTFSGGSNALRSEQGAPHLQQKVELVSDITVSGCLVLMLRTDSHTAFSCSGNETSIYPPMLLIESLQYFHWPCQYLSVGDEVQLVWGVREGGEVGRGLATLSNHIVVCLCVG